MATLPPHDPHASAAAEPAADGFAAAPGERGTLPGEPVAGFPATALRRLYTVAAVLGLASLIPYLPLPVPIGPDKTLGQVLEDYRYWDRLDPSPLVRALTLTPPPKGEAMLAAGQTPPQEEASRELEGAELAALAGMEAAEVPQESTATAHLPTALVVTDKELGEQQVLLEHPERLGRFWTALGELAMGKRAKVRIAHYGDSHLANDGQSHILRQLLQRRFGDGGHGYTLVSARTQWYSHRGIERSSSDGWKILSFLSGNAADGAYGHAGFAAEGGPGQWFELGSVARYPGSQFTLYYRALGPATIQRQVDGKSVDPLVVDAGARGSDFADTWSGPDGVHKVRWRIGAGRVRWFGGAVERERGLVYDSLGEVGTRGTRWSGVNAEHFKEMGRLRPVDLFILDYGGNERVDKPTEDAYVAKLTGVVQMFQAAQPGAACALFGPPDHGHKKAGKVISDPVVVKLVGWQRKVADATGCAFYDQRAFMGGDGAMGRWVAKGWGWGDMAHFTPQGERVMAQGVYRALLAGGAPLWKTLAAAPPAPPAPAKDPAKPKAKGPAKPAAKPAVKPAIKSQTKPAPKPAPKGTVKRAVASPAKATAKLPVKPTGANPAKATQKAAGKTSPQPSARSATGKTDGTRTTTSKPAKPTRK